MKTATLLLAAGLTLAGGAAWAQTTPAGPKGSINLNYPAPRYQIYEAPKPYGGLLMLDTTTGETYQRIIVNTPRGIAIRWLKLDRMNAVGEGEAVLWD